MAHSDSPRGGIFDGLRGMVLHLDPATTTMGWTPDSPAVWGGLMDMSYARGAATLVCLRDGTTSLYTSTGGGILGAGGHPGVAAASMAFLAELGRHTAAMRPDTDESLPARGARRAACADLCRADDVRGGRGRPRLRSQRAVTGVPRRPRGDHPATSARRAPAAPTLTIARGVRRIPGGRRFALGIAVRRGVRTASTPPRARGTTGIANPPSPPYAVTPVGATGH